MSTIHKELKTEKQQQFNRFESLKQVKEMKLLENPEDRRILDIVKKLGSENSISKNLNEQARQNDLRAVDSEYGGEVYEIGQIKDLCRRYNLRFLKAQQYCGNIDLEVGRKLRQLEKEHALGTDAHIETSFFILAPSRAFSEKHNKKVMRTYNPAIFFQVNQGMYKLIHNWGGSFTLAQRLAGLNWENRHTKAIFQSIVCLAAYVSILALFTNPWSWLLCLVAAPITFILVGAYGGYSAAETGQPFCKDSQFHSKKWTIEQYKDIVK